jgi:Copper binding proteins, plastocyanin/azurin family
MLRLHEHVKAEHGFEERRVGVRDALQRVGGKLEPDRNRILFLVKKLTRSCSARDSPARMRWLVAIVAVPVVGVAVFLGTAGAQGELLIATVGTNDGWDIGLHHQDGRPVTQIPPGTYTIRVRDLSRIHNIHLASRTDASVDFRTELEFVGEQDFTVTFKDGHRYAYACEPHWQTMNGEFFVFSPRSPPTPAPKVSTLSASVSPSGGATLSARSAKSGAYKVVVRDRSARHNFRLRGRGVNRATSTRFVGSVTWRVRLAKGVYRFGSDAKRTPGRLRVR